jgi:hypothetical protein
MDKYWCRAKKVKGSLAATIKNDVRSVGRDAIMIGFFCILPFTDILDIATYLINWNYD